MLSEVDAAWLAAAIDGEGYIGLYYPKDKGRKTDWPKPEIGIVNTVRTYPAKAHKLLGGSITPQDKRQLRNTYGLKTVYRWTISGSKRTLPVLKAVLPYLIIKKDKAGEIIRFIESRDWGNERNRHEESRRLRSEAMKALWVEPQWREERLLAIRKGYPATCTICGVENEHHYIKGQCRRCNQRLYMREVRRKRREATCTS